YYVVLYNERYLITSLDFTIEYEAKNVPDFSVTSFYQEAVQEIPQQTFTIPNDGNWYFFIYLDPMNSLEEQTEITFDITYETKTTPAEQWATIFPIVIIFTVILAIIFIGVFIARKNQKKVLQASALETPSINPYKKTQIKKETPEKLKQSELIEKPLEKKCLRCGTMVPSSAYFCTNCGKKFEGRDLGKPELITPSGSKTCIYCGSTIKKGERFCHYCGVKIEASNDI
ncbi:MAG: zinc ribbon domain-containing protein, partial [Promethearchaeota archaeon]